MSVPGIDGREERWHFGPGDSIRFRGVGSDDALEAASATEYARHGLIPGRVFTVAPNGGTYNPNGVVSIAGTRGALRARYFELVKRAEPKPAPAPDFYGPKWGTGYVAPYGRLRGFLVRAAGDYKPARYFVAPLPDRGYTVHSGSAVDEVDFQPDESEAA